MSQAESARIPAARYAGRVIHPGSPTLRIRYRAGVLITPYGFPHWPLYAHTMVQLPAPRPDLTLDETRILDVLTANWLLTVSGEQEQPAADASLMATPGGWTWTHVAMTRHVALVPTDLHRSFRHLGGVATMPVPRERRGVDIAQEHHSIGLAGVGRLAEETVAALERRLGATLPPVYRGFLRRTNGARPLLPGLHLGFGFLADQPLFGLGRADRQYDLPQVNAWLGDRLTPRFLAIGDVQGGLLAVQTTGADRDSIWYYDDDNVHDTDDRLDAAGICRHLLYRCADDVDAFFRALTRPPRRLVQRAADDVRTGAAHIMSVPDMGAELPRTHKPS